jgi:hypothetical protein
MTTLELFPGDAPKPKRKRRRRKAPTEPPAMTLRERGRQLMKKGATYGEVVKALGLKNAEEAIALLHGSAP